MYWLSHISSKKRGYLTLTPMFMGYTGTASAIYVALTVIYVSLSDIFKILKVLKDRSVFIVIQGCTH